MTNSTQTRRKAIQAMVAAGSAGSVSTRDLSAAARGKDASAALAAIRIDATRRFTLSPYLFVQFIEPFGVNAPVRCGSGCAARRIALISDKEPSIEHLRPDVAEAEFRPA
jgi:hypothetical protein